MVLALQRQQVTHETQVTAGVTADATAAAQLSTLIDIPITCDWSFKPKQLTT